MAATDAHPLALLVDAHIRFVGRHQPSSESGHEGDAHERVVSTEDNASCGDSAPVDDATALSASGEDQPWVGPGLGGHGSSLTHWIADAMFASGLYWGLHIEELLGNGAINRKWALRRLHACRAHLMAYSQSMYLQHSRSLLLKHRGNTAYSSIACSTEGGFAGSPGHDAHVLYTYSAVQAIALCGTDPRTLFNVDALVAWVAGLQRADGSFSCDEFGDDDTRYTYAALATLHLLGRLDAVDRNAAVKHVLRCRTPEHAFGVRPGAEAHAGQTFCSVAALALCDAIAEVKDDLLLLMWLSERQNKDGGVNGRPGKRSDVCYAWWVGATCAIVERLDVIDRDALIQSVLAHQHEAGGIAAHRGDRPDLFHTHFGIAALGVLGHPRIPPVDPVLCLPATTLGKITHCHQDS